MTARIISSVLAIFFFLTSISFSNSAYKMTICDIEVLSSNKVQACVYIENIEEELILTSYQCALSINQQIDLSSLSFTYIEESSELLNEPNLFVGVDNIDGPTELTFVSYIGNDVITQKTLVGKFILEGNVDTSQIDLLSIHWDFEGTISTILTGENFVNITNPANHESIFPSNEPVETNSLLISNVIASDGSASAYKVIDGLGYYDEGDSRWATEGMPTSLIFDMGEKTKISKTRFSFYKFSDDRIYQYNVKVSDDMDNWRSLLNNVDSKPSEWSEEEFDMVEARYLELEVLSSSGSNQSDWVSIWEAEIWGIGTPNSIEEDLEDSESSEEIPSEYSVSQNYPNPFNPSTTVQIRMKNHDNVVLNVYNILGEKVLNIIDQELTAGIHEVNIDGSNLASGMYIYQLVIGNEFSETKKMQLMK